MSISRLQPTLNKKKYQFPFAAQNCQINSNLYQHQEHEKKLL